jgi:hypothetical protein
MENRRSSIIQQNQMSKSSRLSLIRQEKDSSLMNTVIINDQNDVSVKNFVQSCPYRIEDIDRNAIVK